MVATVLDNTKDGDTSGNIRMGEEVGYQKPWLARLSLDIFTTVTQRRNNDRKTTAFKD